MYDVYKIRHGDYSMADIIDRLKGYAEASEAMGLYTEAKCAYDAIEEIKSLRSRLNEANWAANPDRSGGAFTQEEITNSSTWR
jgi:hypothetical protein